MPLPNFLILGETKCGTTSMYNNLVQHPKILSTLGNGSKTITDDGDVLNIKELRFFDRHYAKGWDWYSRCFPQCPPGAITGEATPMYLYRTQALERITSVLTDCKFIVMLRNPVDRLISHYGHLYNLSADWRAKYPTVDDFWFAAREEDYYLIDKGIYWQTLERLYSYCPRTQVHIVIAEKLFSLPQQVFDDTLKFLEVSPMQLQKPKHSRANRKQKPKVSTSVLSEIRMFYQGHQVALDNIVEQRIPWEFH